MKTLRHLRLLLPVMLLVQLSQAQQYPVRLYTTADGLSQMQVMSVFTDSRGLLWAGTKFGISRFNGERFEQLHPRLLKGAEFYAITEDRNGNLWFTKSYGLGNTRYNGHQVRHYPNLPHPIHFDHQNRGWTVDAESRLCYFYQDSLYRADRLLPALRNERVGNWYYDEAGRQLLIITHSNRVFLYRQNKLVSLPCAYKFNFEPIPPRLISDRFHYMLTAYHPDKPKTIRYLYFDGQQLVPLADYEPNGRFAALRPVSFDYYVVLNGKLYRMDRQTTQLRLVTAVLGGCAPFTQAGNSQFVGTEQGLCRLTDVGFRHFDRTGAPYVWSVAEDKNGIIWWMNFRSAIRLWDGHTIRNGPDFKLPMANDWYYGSRRGPDNALYLGNGRGVVRYDGNRHTLLAPPGLENQEFVTWSTLSDARRGWLVQGSTGQVNVFKRGKLIRQFGPAQGLPDFGNYYALAQDRQDNYWIGGSGGFCRLNPDTRQVKAYTHANNRFLRTTVMGLGFDSTQTLWIASAKGLSYLDPKTDSVRHICPELFDTPVLYFGIKNNYLFAGDLRTLHVLDLAHFHRTGEVHIKGFNQNNGFLGIEPGQNGFFCDSKNRVWIPSGSVLSYLDLNKFRFVSDPLRAGIYAINDSLLRFQHRPDSVLHLPYGEDMIKITGEAIGFDRPTRTQYRYRLNGGIWSDWLRSPEIYLTDLKQGRHQFEFEARRNSQTGELPALAAIQFQTHLPFYKWAIFPYLGIVLFVGGLSLLGYLSYRDQRNMLQAEEQELRLSLLQIQTLQAQLNPHFVSNALGSIQESITVQNHERANRQVVELASLFRSFLDSSVKSNDLFRKSRRGESDIGLDKEIKLLRNYINFEQLHQNNRFTYDIWWPQGFDPMLRTLPPILIQPFVENALVHGLNNLPNNSPGHLQIRCYTDPDDRLVIEVEDNGVGRAEVARIQQKAIKPHVSHGSNLVEDRIRLLNQIGYQITLGIEDAPTGGTLVRLIIDG